MPELKTAISAPNHGAPKLSIPAAIELAAKATPALKLTLLNSIDELQSAATLWDDLWLRSELALPTLRAEQVAWWLETFAGSVPWRALVVEEGNRFVAALPLVERRRGHLLKTASLPTNLASPSGDLLLDPQSDVARATDLLAEELLRGPWMLAWFDFVPWGLPRWRAMLEAFERHGLATSVQPLYSIGQVEIGHDWETYEASRSRNHRQQMRKLWRRIERQGATRLVRHADLSASEVAPLLRRGFEVEDRSWKGGTSTSVLRTPGACEFYARQAELLNARGELELVFLEHQERAIAFEYGWRAKQVYFSLKVGYDGEFASYRPGQLLRSKLYEAFHTTGDCRLVDYLGPLSDATQRWSTRQYEIARLVIGGRGRSARWGLRLIEALQHARSKARDARPTSEGTTSLDHSHETATAP
ncbi:MAG: GNAT family N-acetyltransferase [Pirellulales bacterium]|nr:GNAT family N-acetyltransferase [Pirellulales bacterium]